MELSLFKVSWFILVPEGVQSFKKGHQIIFIVLYLGLHHYARNANHICICAFKSVSRVSHNWRGVKTAEKKKSFPSICASKYIFIMGHYLTCFFVGVGQLCNVENVQAYILHTLLSAIYGRTQQDSQGRLLNIFSVWMFKHIECKNAIWGYKCLRHKAAADCSRRTFINIFNLQFISHLVYKASCLLHSI